MRVAIVDDERTFAEQVRELAEACLGEQEEDYEVKTYELPTELLWDLQEGEYFDVYLLDVEMPGMDGLALANQIRQRYEKPYIIFVTAHMQYSIKGYEYGVFRYITKDALRENLPVALWTIAGKLRTRQEKYYVLEQYSRIRKLFYDDIYFMRKEGKYTYFRTRDGECRDRKPLSQVLRELDGEEFVCVDKSCAVNLKHVMQLEGSNIVMRGGEQLPVSEPRARQVKKILSVYWRGRR